MKKLKVITVVGTRPEIIRLSRVIVKLDTYCEHILVHTGQNYDYELNEIFFNDLNIRKPDYFLNAAGGSSCETIGNVIISVDRILDIEKPEAVLVLGDTNSCMAVIPAKRRKIPTFHMEAGNRCFDMRVPEEINRRIVDHTADINLTYSQIAREYLLREGLLPEMVIKTGSPMNEVLCYYSDGIKNSKILDKLSLETNKFFVVSAHREENIDYEDNLKKLINILNQIASLYDYPVIVSTHPRTKLRIDRLNANFDPLIKFVKPLGFKDYVKLQCSSFAVLSDSGTITEESSILNFPALNIREAHERPEGMEEASVMLSGLDVERVLQCLDIIKEQHNSNSGILRRVSDYDVTNVSEKVVRIIHSYTDYVNKRIWRK